MKRHIAALALVLAVAPSTAPAQVRASERATVSQTVDGTVFTINYARPRLRGRSVIFGGEVKWGEVWTPGANWATTLDVSRDVMLDGHAVPKGKYSVWFVVRRDKWTVVLDPRSDLYHTEPPDSSARQVRWDVTPATAPITESLTWSFPEVRVDGARIQFDWETRRVTINATVAPSHPLTVARDVAAPMVGTYSFQWIEDGKITDAGRIELYYDGTSLRQRYTPAPSWYPRIQDQPMVRLTDEWYIPAILRNGQVWEMVADMIFEFTIVNGRATGFELRDDRDKLIGSGKRVNP